MKIIAFSDGHGVLPEPKELPKCDLILIGGDIVPLRFQSFTEFSMVWFTNVFLKMWCKEVDCDKIVFIAGNHDFFIEDVGIKQIIKTIKDCGLENKVEYLQDSMYIYKGKSIWGCPWCNALKGWAFYTADELEYRSIPNCNILLTHNAPTYEDVATAHFSDGTTKTFGSIALLEAIKNRSIDYVFCGHIHTGSHERTKLGDTNIYNVSIKNEDYNAVFKPLIIDVYD